MDTPSLRDFAAAMADRGIDVVRFNLPYVEAGRKAPGPRARDEACWRAVAAQLRPSAKRLVLGGRSYGGRMASHVAAEGVACDGLLFLAYPLHPPGKPTELRTDHLARITRADALPARYARPVRRPATARGARSPHCRARRFIASRAPTTATRSAVARAPTSRRSSPTPPPRGSRCCRARDPWRAITASRGEWTSAPRARCVRRSRGRAWAGIGCARGSLGRRGTSSRSTCTSQRGSGNFSLLMRAPPIPAQARTTAVELHARCGRVGAASRDAFDAARRRRAGGAAVRRSAHKEREVAGPPSRRTRGSTRSTVPPERSSRGADLPPRPPAGSPCGTRPMPSRPAPAAFPPHVGGRARRSGSTARRSARRRDRRSSR